MTQEERQEVGKALAYTAIYYRQQFEKNHLSMMLEDLESLSANEILSGLKRWRMNPKNDRFPMPAKLIEFIQAKPENRDSALIAASRVREAIQKFGYTNPDGAREFIGDLGWNIIRRFGGWQHLCENLGVELSEQTFFAQFRDVATAEQNIRSLGHSDYKPALDYKQKSNDLTKSGDVLKLLNIKKEIE